jgi:ferredoxin
MSIDGGKNKESFPMQIDVEKCGDCVYCISVCPYEALAQDPETKRVKIDTEKCMLCGLCYTACPSRLITIDYYDFVVLTEYVKQKMESTGYKTLAVVCKGSAPPKEFLDKELGTTEYILLALPCVGRVHMQFYLDVADLGLDNILLVSCNEDDCRFEKGSKIAKDRVDTVHLYFEDMYCTEAPLTHMPYRVIVDLDQSKCSGCRTCIEACPYDALELKDGKSSVKEDVCKGCGTCIAVCRNSSIQEKIVRMIDMISSIESAVGD